MTNTPSFKELSDQDLVGLISYCEKWDPMTVYHTAYKQVFSGKQLEEVMMPFEDWCDKQSILPPIVRNELIRACVINLEMGRMTKLKHAAAAENLIKNWAFWLWIFVVIWWWWF
jgi:hypothetical protein|tara:strand:+ start:698 stop:1039 length:342 start_codon:yes stop_codon:yes gene_type:complete